MRRMPMTMEIEHERLYQQFLSAMDGIRSWDLTPGAELEGCYRVAGTYNTLLESHQPAADAILSERVSFYKGARPLFVAELRFCSWCYHALLFQPAAGIREWKVFWIRETNRVRQYIEENEDLYQYYLDDQTDRDEDLFGGDGEDADRYADILGECLALDRYAVYLNQSFDTFIKT
jgi:hypothetical protein